MNVDANNTIANEYYSPLTSHFEKNKVLKIMINFVFNDKSHKLQLVIELDGGIHNNKEENEVLNKIAHIADEKLNN